MEYFAVIDTETTWFNEVMSVGVIISDVASMNPIFGKCYIVDPEYKRGGMFSSVLMIHGDANTLIATRNECLDDIESILKEYKVEKILAYNAAFDKRNLPELHDYVWCDIMKIAAYRQYNKFIPTTVECFWSGKMKKGYSVENMIRMLTQDENYCETHNAYLDAIDELNIVRCLNLKFKVYEDAII